MEDGLQLRGKQEGCIVQVGVVVARGYPLLGKSTPVGGSFEWMDVIRCEHKGVVTGSVGGLIDLSGRGVGS